MPLDTLLVYGASESLVFLRSEILTYSRPNYSLRPRRRVYSWSWLVFNPMLTVRFSHHPCAVCYSRLIAPQTVSYSSFRTAEPSWYVNCIHLVV